MAKYTTLFKEINLVEDSEEMREDGITRSSNLKHVALALVLDVSLSMRGFKIDSLNNAINEMISSLNNDARLKDIVDLGVFAFGEKEMEPVIQGFHAIRDCKSITLKAIGRQTYVVNSLKTAIDRLRERTALYTEGGTGYKPWLILITDGNFFDEDDELDSVASTIKERERANKLHFMGFGVADSREEILYSKSQLLKFTDDPRKVVDINSRDFSELFSWIGRSVAIISSTTPGATVQLPQLTVSA